MTKTRQSLWQELQSTRRYLHVIEQKASQAKPDALPEWEGLITRLQKRHAYLESSLSWDSHDTHLCLQ